MLPIQVYEVCVVLLVLALLTLFYFYVQSYLHVAKSDVTGPVFLDYRFTFSLLFLKNTIDLHKWLTKMISLYPSPFGIRLGLKSLYFVHDPEQMKIIFNNPHCLNKTYTYKFLLDWIGSGLLTSQAQQWRIQRKAIQPMFKHRGPARFVSVTAKHTVKVLKDLEVHLDGNKFDVLKYILTGTLNANVETLLGVSVSEEDGFLLHRIIRRAMDIVMLRGMKVWLQPSFIFKHTSLGKEQQHCINEFCRIVTKLIKKNQKLREEQNSSKSTDDDTEGRKPIYEMLCESEYKFSDEEIMDEIRIIIAAGYDTVGTSITSMLYFLANNMHIQDKVYDELYEVYQDKDPETTEVQLDDIQQLRYLDCVIKESLRLISPATYVGRRVDGELTLEGYTVPKGSEIMLLIHHMQRSEKYWPKPLEFIPERFLPGHPLEAKTASAYLPFAAGPRNCIAAIYAPYIAKTVISMLLRKYVFKMKRPQHPSELEIRADLVVTTKEPIKLSIERRTPRSSKR